MATKDYGYSYDYSNQKPLHTFVNNTNKSSISVFKEYSSYIILQKDSKGFQQRLKVDEVNLNSMMTRLINNGWIDA
jgi:hypothetical protein